MQDGWLWADDGFNDSPMGFAWDEEDDEAEWNDDLDWDGEDDDLDEAWDGEDDDEEWEEWESEFDDDVDDSFGRRRAGPPQWN